MKFATALIAGVLLLAGVNSSHAAIRIADDRGGKIGTYIDRYQGLRSSGETVIIDGKTVMENREIPGMDMSALLEEAQASGERVWASLPDWDPLERTADNACPYCYPLIGGH